MAWEARGKSKFYYQARRVGGRVVKTYLGSGRRAALAARQDAEARTAAEADAAAARAMAEEFEPLERLGDEADGQVDLLLEAVLLAAGHHNHKGQWRRRRHGRHDDDDDDQDGHGSHGPAPEGEP